ncbi:hypothetical protein AGMMS49983_11870 [Clostridia bacterium]|nr:hypothetical protein AGMMS49983_11870 [Clostridia bacterium]
MYCGKCGKEVKDGAKFCSGCGTAMHIGTGAASVQKPAEKPAPVYAPAGDPANSPQVTQVTQVNRAGSEEQPDPKYLEHLIAEAKKGKASGGKSLAGGIVMVVVWMICFFTPAIWTNIIFFIIAGPIAIVAGIVMIASNGSELEALENKLRASQRR